MTRGEQQSEKTAWLHMWVARNEVQTAALGPKTRKIEVGEEHASRPTLNLLGCPRAVVTCCLGHNRPASTRVGGGGASWACCGVVSFRSNFAVFFVRRIECGHQPPSAFPAKRTLCSIELMYWAALISRAGRWAARTCRMLRRRKGQMWLILVATSRGPNDAQTRRTSVTVAHSGARTSWVGPPYVTAPARGSAVCS